MMDDMECMKEDMVTRESRGLELSYTDYTPINTI